jgi:hypothetical protein
LAWNRYPKQYLFMRQTPTTVTLLSLFLFLAVSTAGAQPSGGPYGPVPRHYDLPDANALIFVAPDGDPVSEGNSIEAPTTLESAMASASTGDAIILRGGTYRTGSLRLNQGITIQPYAAEVPVIVGTLPATDWEPLADGRWRTYWDRLFPAAPADWWRAEHHLKATPMHRFHYDMVFVGDQRLLSAGSLEELNEGNYYIDYAEGWVYLGFDPAGKKIEITAHDSALVRTIRSVHGRDNDRIGPTIRGITFTRYARLALLVEGVEPGEPMNEALFGKDVVGTILEDVTISHCSRVAGYFRGDRFTMRNCLVADCGTEGIYVINSADVLLERNIVTRTNSFGSYMGYYASAIKVFNQSHRVICRDNLIIDNPMASGIWYDVGNDDGIVVNNWVERTNDGFFFEISTGALCAGNVFFDCSPGVRVLNSANVAVYQNTFYNSALEVTRSMRSSEAGDHFGWHASAGPAVANRDGNTVHNNLFIAEETFVPALIQVWESPGVDAVARAGQLASLDGNAYVRRDHGKPLITWGESIAWNRQEVTLAANFLKAVREQNSDWEIHGGAWFGYQGPVVQNAGEKEMKLAPGFQGFDLGITIADDVRNALGWQKIHPPFPGAYAPGAL